MAWKLRYSQLQRYFLIISYALLVDVKTVTCICNLSHTHARVLSSSSSEVENQVIWNNKSICIESKSIYNSRLIDLGISVRIGDLYDTRGDFKSNKEPTTVYSTLSPVEHFLLFSLCNALPEEWRKVLKTNKTLSAQKLII